MSTRCVTERQPKYLSGLATLLATFLVLFIGGCSNSSDVQPVSGTVTLDGQPLAGVMVRFTPQTGEKRTTSLGKTDEQGRYELRYTSQQQGALIGIHKVQVVNIDGLPEPGMPKAQKVPKQYDVQSELTAEVTPSENIFNFELTSKK
ncbi:MULTISPECIES: DUF4198 domain-containing protein [Pirellulaceae]|nr:MULTISPECIES: DUF4198 domain-containing protein [Pirellulaceae]